MRFLFLVICILCSMLAYTQAFDSTIISFDLDKTALSKNEIQQLSTMATRLNADASKKILIYGYADYLGNDDYNKQLSTKRANVVHDFLLKKGVSENQVLVCMGLGKRNDKGNTDEVGNPLFRKVLILEKTNAHQPKSMVRPIILDSPAVVSMSQTIAQTDENQVFILQDVNFHRHTTYLTDESIPKLQELFQIMKDNPSLRIQLEGHICCNTVDGMLKGTFSYQLSILRAKAIRNFLVNNNIAPNRVQYTGFGRTRPLFEDETIEANINANMRVEVRVLSK